MRREMTQKNTVPIEVLPGQAIRVPCANTKTMRVRPQRTAAAR
jgi:hypothetical protein